MILVFLLSLRVLGIGDWWVAALFAVGAFALGLLMPLVMMRWIVRGSRRV
jgi:hypothetical protein